MKRAVRRALLLSALAAPSALYALGLGEIRLNSALNQPFDAEIELVSAAPEDLAALRAALASNDTFQRYGLEKAQYLADFTFRVARSGGRDVLRVTSPRPVTEPFVTLLVEASWPRGRLLREYTVLLDPPAFASAPAAMAPVAAPRAATTPAVTPSVPPPAVEPVPQPEAPTPVSTAAADPGPAIEAGSTYRVRPNDTLSGVASVVSSGSRSEINRTMVAIYEANPDAFAGNINVLRSGSDLRIPTRSEVAAISASAAADEVARQYRLWNQGATSAAPVAETSGRLRLVTPEQGSAAPSSATDAPAAAAATDAELRARLSRLEAELAETRRLLEVRNAELATLQGSAPPAEAAQPVAEAASPPVPVPEAMPEETPAAEGPAGAPAAAEPEAVATPKPEPKAAPAAAPEDEPTLLDRLRDYAWALLALLAAALGIAFWLRRRRASRSGDDRLEETLGRGTSDDLRAGAAVASRPGRSDELFGEVPAAVSLTVPTAVAAGTAAGWLAEPSRPVTVADTLSGDGAISIEAGDPLAEADFHMAYGLYDQAADLVQVALHREPHRRDLQLKLVEVFFVWGNRERFVELAREMHATRAQAEPGEWDKVLIMGRQLAPEDPMFAAAPSSAVSGALDLELHAGAAPTDFDLPGGEAPPLDLDLTTLGPEVRGDESVDFLIDEPLRGRGEDETALAPTVETPRVRRTADEPTVEVPTAEVPIEDLGLATSDLAGLEELTQVEAELTRSAAPVEDTVQEPALRGARETGEAEPDLMSATSMLTVDLAALSEAVAAESNTVNLDLSERTAELATVELATVELAAVDEEAAPEADEPGPFEEITMSEIGTKLDLARAYVDMGDPEGARSILEEVIKEGSGAHKQEAERLMVGLP